ncbi:uncharacterized protein C8A04DRAFT_25265, partial [Dichotomopilus funicola]
MGSQLDCCPFSPVATSQGVYTGPDKARDAVVKSCPTNYYAAAGHCCPSILSTVITTIVPPSVATTGGSLTAGRRDHIPRSDKPIVTVSATVFAMQYAIGSETTGVSPGEIAGAVIGVAVIGGILLGLYLASGRRREIKDGLNSPEQQTMNNNGQADVDISPGSLEAGYEDGYVEEERQCWVAILPRRWRNRRKEHEEPPPPEPKISPEPSSPAAVGNGSQERGHLYQPPPPPPPPPRDRSPHLQPPPRSQRR